MYQIWYSNQFKKIIYILYKNNLIELIIFLLINFFWLNLKTQFSNLTTVIINNNTVFFKTDKL